MRHARSAYLLAAGCAALFLTACSHQTQPEIHVFALGDKIELGHIRYRIFETQWMTQIPQDPAPRLPKNRFLLVRLNAVNIGSGELMVPNLTIEDDGGNAIHELESGEGVPQWIGTLRRAKEGDTVEGNIAFDAAPQHYKLRLLDENGDTSALVDLPLNFNTPGPEITLPAPESKKK